MITTFYIRIISLFEVGQCIFNAVLDYSYVCLGQGIFRFCVYHVYCLCRESFGENLLVDDRTIRRNVLCIVSVLFLEYYFIGITARTLYGEFGNRAGYVTWNGISRVWCPNLYIHVLRNFIFFSSPLPLI